MQRTQVQSLVGELRSHMLQGNCTLTPAELNPSVLGGQGHCPLSKELYRAAPYWQDVS